MKAQGQSFDSTRCWFQIWCIPYVWLLLWPTPRWANGVAVDIPSWDSLGQTLIPSAPPPVTLDCCCMNQKGQRLDPTPQTVRLFRERNGWCIYSARLWLALELKGISYETVLVASRGDTFDGSLVEEGDGRPEFLGDQSLPLLQYAQESQLHEASTEASSIDLLRELDAHFPESIPLFSKDEPDPVLFMAHEFEKAVPSNARYSPRAAWLFCNEEGFRLDALHRSAFEKFLDQAESLLSNYDGPFFCGQELSAADVVWAPLLERYSVQLPCLHDQLVPRHANLRPRLYQWYQAMDTVPAYACRVRGDGPSWRRVLFVDPWWPKADLWHPRDTVGPKGELLLSEQECCAIFGSTEVGSDVWDDYAKSRPYVSKNPRTEVAVSLIRNREALSKDASNWMEQEGYVSEFSLDELDTCFRAIAWILGLDKEANSFPADDPFFQRVTCILIYLDKRLCVPRDFGAPSAAALRKLCTEFSSRFGQVL
uniref:GST C-terminal domain-containing protein n=1 Tax=Entomoneis paludosa TaxID=265537 RepID=A0A7S2YQB5_9STRA|mmetsp:Transcript_5336/g.11302  ORF Transcript_5336/g.11302 Transcript_5336/m.11302 type:complete len:481 (+) Transcript_5336:47-1489(+)